MLWLINLVLDREHRKATAAIWQNELKIKVNLFSLHKLAVVQWRLAILSFLSTSNYRKIKFILT